MLSTPTLAAIRFGYGLSPDRPAPADAAALLASLSGPDGSVTQFPIPSTAETTALSQEYIATRAVRRAADKALGAKDKQAARSLNLVRRKLTLLSSGVAMASLGRAAFGPDPFRERLVRFWVDHFTVRAKNSYEIGAVSAFADEAVRPHLTGRFAEMLMATTTHPAMLVYLDQVTSFGPNSAFAKRHDKGLNENLAREVLELHTLGVGGGYGQTDVRAFANLLTGLLYDLKEGFRFQPSAAEPGADLVLGKSYGGAGKASLADIAAALNDIALHPDTANHLAQSLAVHFIADEPDPALVSAMAQAYLQSGGELEALYAAMLDHPAAWAPALSKAKQPFDFIASALRALNVDMNGLQALPPKQANLVVLDGLRRMGQPFQEPLGPNGWPEDAEAWINPQGLAARIEWAMKVPKRLMTSLPDPRAFLDLALAEGASPVLQRAVGGAASAAEGVGLVLASAEFNRR